MVSPTGRWMLTLGAAASSLALTPLAGPAQAQRWSNDQSCRNRDGRERERCERERSRWQNRRERERRKDARAEGVVAGVVGAAVIGGIIAAATSDNGKKKKRERERQDLCGSDGYNSSYDPRKNSYRASDGRWYSCD